MRTTGWPVTTPSTPVPTTLRRPQVGEQNCVGCEYHGDCAGVLSGFMGWGSPWGVIENGTEEKPHCPTWRRRHEDEESPDA
jgi:hypothetical protein